LFLLDGLDEVPEQLRPGLVNREWKDRANLMVKEILSRSHKFTFLPGTFLPFYFYLSPLFKKPQPGPKNQPHGLKSHGWGVKNHPRGVRNHSQGLKNHCSIPGSIF
jgi:hypothetical protein